MSDGLTDNARDEERGKRIREHLVALKNCLEFAGEYSEFLELRKRVIDTAEACDALHGRGYITGETDIRAGLRAQIDLLLALNEEAWTKFLAALDDEWLPLFKKLSPFNGGLFCVVDYGNANRSVRISGDLERYFTELIRERGLVTHDCDTYAVVIPRPREASVTWLHCGILGVKGPRSPK